jgi:hypothetical protein
MPSPPPGEDSGRGHGWGMVRRLTPASVAAAPTICRSVIAWWRKAAASAAVTRTLVLLSVAATETGRRSNPR